MGEGESLSGGNVIGIGIGVDGVNTLYTSKSYVMTGKQRIRFTEATSVSCNL